MSNAREAEAVCAAAAVITKDPARGGRLQRFFDGLGPGLVSGAAGKFYAAVAVAVLLGLALSSLGLDAVRMLFWAAVVNGALAPPLVVLVVLLTNDPKVMGERVSPPLLRQLGWAAALVMSAAGVAIFVLWLV